LSKRWQGLLGPLKHFILKIKVKGSFWSALSKLDTQIKDILYSASCKFYYDWVETVTGFIETCSFPENFEEIMKNWDERIVKIDIFSITEAPQQMTRESLEVKRCIQDGSVNRNNADRRRSSNTTDLQSSGSNLVKNEEVVENIQPKEDDNIDEIQIIVATEDNDTGDWDELVPLPRKATDLENV